MVGGGVGKGCAGKREAHTHSSPPFSPTQPLSREQEYEADAIGVELVRRAGLGDGSAAIFVFRCFDAIADAAGPAGAMTKQLSFLSTHPSSAERAKAVGQRLQGLMDARRERRGGGGGNAFPPPPARGGAGYPVIDGRGGGGFASLADAMKAEVMGRA